MTVTYSKVHEAWANSPVTTTPISAAALDQIEEGVQTAQDTADTATTAAATATSAAASATAAAVSATAAATAATAAAATATSNAAAATAAATAAVARVNHTGTQSSDTLTDGTTSKSFLATERTKLTGIETAATADQTAAELLTAIKTVDGSGSGLDADLLDGLSSAAFATTAQGTTADNAIPLAQKAAANGVASLDALGIIPTNQLPPLAINEVFTAANQVAMLALIAQRGDVARRTDFTPNKVFLLATDSPSTLVNWVEITATGSVTSVDGMTGVVSLSTAYQPLASVLTNTTSSFLTADRTKLDGIEAAATNDQTATEILTKLITVDGPGSLLDADFLDGLSSAAFTQIATDYKVISLNCTDPLGGALVAQTGVAYARIPDALNGWVVNTIAGHFITAGTTSGATTVTVFKESGSTYGTSTGLLGATGTGNLSFAVAAYNVTETLSTVAGATTVATSDRIRVDIGTSPNSAARGLIVQLTLRKP